MYGCVVCIWINFAACACGYVPVCEQWDSGAIGGVAVCAAIVTAALLGTAVTCNRHDSAASSRRPSKVAGGGDASLSAPLLPVASNGSNGTKGTV